MRLRSLLFVPGDRPDRFDKAVASGADAIILDLEDSVIAGRKTFARKAIRDWLTRKPNCIAFVRINPLDGTNVSEDLAAILPAQPDGLVLPKAEGAASIRKLQSLCQGGTCPPILPIATETPAALFQIGSYRKVSKFLCGLTWGAEDLPAAMGASSSREADGRFTAPFEFVRSLALFGAHAASVAAIETVYPDIADGDGLSVYVAQARRDGFTGMMAIHPAQVGPINSGFAPNEADLAWAKSVVTAFAANPQAGALRLDGEMIDRPHLLLAQRILEQAVV